jgi:hypothetical protein
MFVGLAHSPEGKYGVSQSPRRVVEVERRLERIWGGETLKHCATIDSELMYSYGAQTTGKCFAIRYAVTIP